MKITAVSATLALLPLVAVDAFTTTSTSTTTSVANHQHHHHYIGSLTSPFSPVESSTYHHHHGSSSTSMEAFPSARRSAFNMNKDGSNPFGINVNAEVWNGRLAQISFVWIFIQELIQGKGVLQGIQEGDPVNVISAGVFMSCLLVLGARFAMEPYVDENAPVVPAPRRPSPRYAVDSSNFSNVRNVLNPSAQDGERVWNFNDGRSPFGFKKNAEIWNGRVAQISFVWLFLQEWIQGKGIIDGIEEGDDASLAAVGVFSVLIGALTAFLNNQSKKDFVSRAVSNEDLQAAPEKPVWRSTPTEPTRYEHPLGYNTVTTPLEVYEPEIASTSAATADLSTWDAYMKARAASEKPAVATAPVATTTASTAPPEPYTWESYRRSLESYSAEPAVPVKKEETSKVASADSWDMYRETLDLSKGEAAVPTKIHVQTSKPSPAPAKQARTSEPYTWDSYRRSLETQTVASVPESDSWDSYYSSTLEVVNSEPAVPAKIHVQTSEPLSGAYTWESYRKSLESGPESYSYANTIPDVPLYKGEPAASAKVYPPTSQSTPTSSYDSYRKSLEQSSDYDSAAYNAAYVKALEKYQREKAKKESNDKWSIELAELWNGRFAQMAFVIVFAQELIQGQGVIQGIIERNPINLTALAVSTLTMLVTTVGYLVMGGESTSSVSSAAAAQKEWENKRRMEPRPPAAFEPAKIHQATKETVPVPAKPPVPQFRFGSNTAPAAPATESSIPLAVKPEVYLNLPPTVRPPPNPGRFSFKDETRSFAQSQVTMPTAKKVEDTLSSIYSYDNPTMAGVSQAYQSYAETLSASSRTPVSGSSYLDALSQTSPPRKASGGSYLDSLSGGATFLDNPAYADVGVTPQPTYEPEPTSRAASRGFGGSYLDALSSSSSKTSIPEPELAGRWSN